jgi:hypothetical protein
MADTIKAIEVVVQCPDNEFADLWREQKVTLSDAALDYGACTVADRKVEVLRGCVVDALVATFAGAAPVQCAASFQKEIAADGGYVSHMEVL